MQWRMLARRCPSGSMTIVGDFGQASRPGALGDVGRRPRRAARTARRRRHVTSRSTTAPRPRSWSSRNRLLPAAAPGIEPARAGAQHRRRTRWSTPSSADDLVAGRRRGRRRRVGSGGTVAVIAPPALHAELVAALAGSRRGGRTRSTRSTPPIAVLSPLDTKGLEFDHVVVVEPAALVEPDRRRAAAALRHAHPRHPEPVLVHAAPLPEALVDARELAARRARPRGPTTREGVPA